MITRVQVKNFRNLADVDVTLGPLTILVGRNSAGKSTFLDVLRFVRDALHLDLETAISLRGGIPAIRKWSSHGRPHDIEIHLDFADEGTSGHYGFVLGSGIEGSPRVKREFCEIFLGEVQMHPRFESRNGKWITSPRDWFMSDGIGSGFPNFPDKLMLPSVAAFLLDFSGIFKHLTSTNFYSVFPNTLRLPQKQTSNATLLEDGQNLATTLRSIKKRKDFYPDLLAALGRVVEGVNDLRVVEAGGYLVVELKHQIQNNRAPWFPLAQESDGTLRILGLLAALYQETPHSLIAIEEPELSIHPGALTILSEVIQEAAQHSQILITTQSPDLISQFTADQIRVVEQTEGQTQIGPLDETQREAINAQLFSAGDLLRIEGLRAADLNGAIALA